MTKFGELITRGVYEDRPTSGSIAGAGRLFFPSDGFSVDRFNDGGNWNPYGPVYPLSTDDPPTTWVNQNDTVLTVAGGGYNMYDPAQGSESPNYSLLVKSAPSTPYTITALFLITPPWIANYVTPFYFGWRDTGDGKLSMLRMMIHTGVWKLNHLKASSPTNDVANYYDINAFPFAHLWLRIADDGTDLTQHLSPDGFNFHQIHTIGRNDYLNSNGPDQVLWGCASRSVGVAVSTTLLSWKES